MTKGFLEKNPDVDITYLRHEINRGKGAALHTGIEKATGDYIIVQDADLEYDPMEFNILSQNLLSAALPMWYTVHVLRAVTHTGSYFSGTL